MNFVETWNLENHGDGSISDIVSVRGAVMVSMTKVTELRSKNETENIEIQDQFVGQKCYT